MEHLEREMRLDELERQITDYDLTIESLQLDQEIAHPCRQLELSYEIQAAYEGRALAMAEALRLYTMH